MVMVERRGSFEHADDMELGLCGPSATSQYTSPIPQAEVRQLIVRRSANRREFVLESEQGTALLVAERRVGRGSGSFDIFVAGPGGVPEPDPAFDVRPGAAPCEWAVRSLRCECCDALPLALAGEREPKEIVHVAHERVEIKTAKAWKMKVAIPEEGCPACRVGAPRRGPRLNSRLPQWNAKTNCLMLDFFGRAKEASAKNFQLKIEGSQCRSGAKDLCLLYGKTNKNMFGTNAFVLDVRSPLGVAQAFGIALTTCDWQ